jgi:DNA-binding GntR family transcriptional regulator
MKGSPVQSDGQSESVVGRITSVLARRIVLGELVPGQRLRQDHIAQEFGASHVPVREAFRRLEAQGLARNEPRRGVSVAALDPATVIEVTEMRASLEALALRHAMPHVTKAVIEEAREAVSEAEASSDIAVWEAANQRFHRTLAAPCAMPRLLSTIDALLQASSRYLLATWRERDWQPRSDKEHRRIIAAVVRRDADKATMLLSQHILAAGEALVGLLNARRLNELSPTG